MPFPSLRTLLNNKLTYENKTSFYLLLPPPRRKALMYTLPARKQFFIYRHHEHLRYSGSSPRIKRI